MESVDDEEFLSLRLAIATQQPLGCERKNKKRKRGEDLVVNILSYEEEVYSLLQMGEQMLKPTPTGCSVSSRVSDCHKTNKGTTEGRDGLQLIHLLLVTASAINDNNLTSAMANLSELCQNVLVLGDVIQRVSAYFATALTARLLTQKSPFYHTIMKPPTSQEEFLAFTHLYKVSPLYQFAHFTANQAIIEAFENNINASLHVIDFDISYGFQWPSLIQSLSENISTTTSFNNRVSLRITGFSTTLNELQETEARLLSFAKGFRNLSFEFHGLLKGSSNLGNIVKRKNETTVVNLPFHFNRLTTYYSNVTQIIKAVRSLSPSVVTVVEQKVFKKPQSFLSRFMESLHYFAAMFDSLDDCLPIESHERLSIESHFGREIKSVMNIDDQRYENNDMEMWKGRVLLESHGFCEMGLSSKNVMQAKLLLKIRSHSPSSSSTSCVNDGFRVVERDDGKGISLAWQDRCLIIASVWQCV